MTIEHKLLAFLARYPNQQFKPKELQRRLSLRTNEEYQALKGVLRQLQEVNKIERVKNGRFSHLEILQLVIGIFQMTKQGFGFVRLSQRDEEIFIAPRFRGMAVNGDTVEVSLFAEGKQKRNPGEKREGEVVRVVERAHAEIVGTLEQNWNSYSVIPDDARIACDIFVEKEQLHQALVGQKVVVKIDAWGKGHLNPQGHIVEVLGYAGEVSAEMRSVVREFQLPEQFPPAVMLEVEQIPPVIPEEELRRRADYREWVTITIDPDDAKDFDDALSLEQLPDGSYRLGVHIADVSYYVREGSELDQEALRRGTSVYLPNMVVPMLPEKLSSGLCSLRPHEERLTHSILMAVSSRGAVKDYEIHESVIRSNHRFTYGEVQNILDGKETPSWLGERSEAIISLLTMMHTLSTTLTKKRMKDGSIDFDSPEAGFQFDEHGVPVTIIKKERLESHRLVEEFMLLANRMIARRIALVKKEENPKPFLYRIHESPDPDRIKELALFVEKFGYRLNIDSGVSSKVLQKLLAEVRGSEEENVINEVALRSMARRCTLNGISDITGWHLITILILLHPSVVTRI
ncbi:MAG: VacB/RNase II family 3'-5' exoribonuclease [bacterium]